jgi:L-malate glycosyltransferase
MRRSPRAHVRFDEHSHRHNQRVAAASVARGDVPCPSVALARARLWGGAVSSRDLRDPSSQGKFDHRNDDLPQAGTVSSMRLCYLASAASIHTRKWANHFAIQGDHVELISFEPPGGELHENVTIHSLKKRLPLNADCFIQASLVRTIVKRSKIDVLHAHYASSYGTLGRLCGFHPYVLSIWGSDVLDFPKTSAFHRRFLSSNLNSADHICSTSQVMAREILDFCHRPITITPFGVDCSVFTPRKKEADAAGEFVIGTVKTLEPTYGIEYLIRGFALLNKRYVGPKKLRLVIAGQGFLMTSLRKLAHELGVSEKTEFLGFVPHRQVPDVLNRFSVFVAPSVMESFGVATVEASASALPVVVTNVGGLPEVVDSGVTGFIVPPKDPEGIATALLELLENDHLREDMGRAGRRLVLERYEWVDTAKRMERLYDSVLVPRGAIDLPS